MRCIHLPSIAWLACALVAAAPAEAWDPDQCGGSEIKTMKLFRDWLADSFLDDQAPTQNFDYWFPRCRGALPLKEQDVFDRCTSRVKSYGEILSRSDLGLYKGNEEMTNRGFYDAFNHNLAIPACLKDEQLFKNLQETNLSKLASVELTVNRIQDSQVCGDKAIVVPYVSVTVPSIDNPDDKEDNRGRILAWIGDQNISHYVQFAVNANPITKPFQRAQASVVNIKRSEQSSITNPNGAYIFDWTRDPPNSFDYTDFGNDMRCYSCHWNGVIAIHPLDTAAVQDVSNWSGAKPQRGWINEVMKAAETLGVTDSYEVLLKEDSWLQKLNDKYKDAVTAINAQMKTDSDPFKTEGGLRVVGAPGQQWQLPGQRESTASLKLPDLLEDPRLVDNSKKEGKKCTAEERTAVDQLMPEIEYNDCNFCHNTRRKGIYERGGFHMLISKYVGSGFMPPKKEVYLKNNRVISNDTKNALDSATRDKARACFEGAAQERMRAWLKFNDTKGTENDCLAN